MGLAAAAEHDVALADVESEMTLTPAAPKSHAVGVDATCRLVRVRCFEREGG